MRIEDKFNQLSRENRKAFIGYIPFGFPRREYTKDIILALQDAGTDIIELGIPFSDPLADGVVIQRAAETALREGANVENFFDCMEEIKEKVTIPLVIMTYYNPPLQFGIDKFFNNMKKTNISGIMIVDLPIEESREYIETARKYDIDTVFFITPTTSWQRAKMIAAAARGFIYYISVTGITGPKDFAYAPVAAHIKRLKKVTELPVCVGFGIHTRQQAEEVSSFSDGVIVGSKIVEFIGDNCCHNDFLSKLREYVVSLNPE